VQEGEGGKTGIKPALANNTTVLRWEWVVGCKERKRGGGVEGAVSWGTRLLGDEGG